VNANITGEVPTVTIAKSSDPVRTVNIGSVNTQFRIPDDLKVGSGADHPVEILDPLPIDGCPLCTAYRELRVWKANWNAATGVLTGTNASLSHYNKDGAILNPDGTESLSYPYVGPGTGSGLTYLAGLLRLPYDDDGINHMIRVAYSERDIKPPPSGFVPPANKTDACDRPNDSGREHCLEDAPAYPPSCFKVPTQAHCIPMGSVFQLKPSVDCSARKAPGLPGPIESDSSKINKDKAVRILCDGLQKYGMVIADNTGGNRGITIYMEDNLTADWTNPSYLGPTAPPGKDCGGNYGWLFRNYGLDPEQPDCASPRVPSDGIPWDQMRLVRAPASATSW